ncbi:MAG: L-threonylcarbamoyladenylate synthase [Acidobacteriota bacterium]
MAEATPWRDGDDPEPLRALVASGGVLAIPTESSYGLAADPRSADGVAGIFRLKGRPGGEALPVVIADLDQLGPLGVDLDDPVLRAVAGAWPAPLSLVVGTNRPWPAGAGRTTLAVRIPAHPGLRRLLRTLGCALTATSANRSGAPPILDPAHLHPLLGRAPQDGGEDKGMPTFRIFDGGVLSGGPPSTLVLWNRSARDFQVLRPGRFATSDLATLAEPLR